VDWGRREPPLWFSHIINSTSHASNVASSHHSQLWRCGVPPAAALNFRDRSRWRKSSPFVSFPYSLLFCVRCLPPTPAGTPPRTPAPHVQPIPLDHKKKPVPNRPHAWTLVIRYILRIKTKKRRKKKAEQTRIVPSCLLGWRVPGRRQRPCVGFWGGFRVRGGYARGSGSMLPPPPARRLPTAARNCPAARLPVPAT